MCAFEREDTYTFPQKKFVFERAVLRRKFIFFHLKRPARRLTLGREPATSADTKELHNCCRPQIYSFSDLTTKKINFFYFWNVSEISTVQTADEGIRTRSEAVVGFCSESSN